LATERGLRELNGDDSRRTDTLGPIPKATRRPNRVSKHTRNNRLFANIKEIQRNLIRTTMSHESADREECDTCDSTNDRDEIKRLSSTRTLYHWCERRSAKLRSIFRATAYVLRDTIGGGLQWNSSCATVMEKLSGRSESSDPPIVCEFIYFIFPRLDRARIVGEDSLFIRFSEGGTHRTPGYAVITTWNVLLYEYVCLCTYVCTDFVRVCARMKPPSPIIRRWKPRLFHFCERTRNNSNVNFSTTTLILKGRRSREIRANEWKDDAGRIGSAVGSSLAVLHNLRLIR